MFAPENVVPKENLALMESVVPTANCVMENVVLMESLVAA